MPANRDRKHQSRQQSEVMELRASKRVMISTTPSTKPRYYLRTRPTPAVQRYTAGEPSRFQATHCSKSDLQEANLSSMSSFSNSLPSLSTRTYQGPKSRSSLSESAAFSVHQGKRRSLALSKSPSSKFISEKSKTLRASTSTRISTATKRPTPRRRRPYAQLTSNGECTPSRETSTLRNNTGSAACKRYRSAAQRTKGADQGRKVKKGSRTTTLIRSVDNKWRELKKSASTWAVPGTSGKTETFHNIADEEEEEEEEEEETDDDDEKDERSPVHAPTVEELSFWRRRMESWYLNDGLMFVPPLNTDSVNVQYEGWDKNNVPGPLREQVFDIATQPVRRSLWNLTRSVHMDLMFVMSNVQYGSKHWMFCLAADKAMKRSHSHVIYFRNEFDMVIIDRQYGVIVGEIYHAYDNFSCPEEEQDRIVVHVLKFAVRKLNRTAGIVRDMVAFHQPPARVLKTLMLPNISVALLRRALANHPVSRKKLCRCLGIEDSEDPVPLCMTSEDLEDSLRWWRKRVLASDVDRTLALARWSDCLDLLARFIGPALMVRLAFVTSPSLRLHSQSDDRQEERSEAGLMFHDIMLHPQQVSILHVPPRRVFLTGFPGSGKTVTLVVMALDWLQGKAVHIVSTWHESVAASLGMARQLRETVGPTRRQVCLHQFDLSTPGNGTQAAKILSSHAFHGMLFVLIDRPCQSSEFTEFMAELSRQVPTLYCWIASQGSCPLAPPSFTHASFTEPLRTPPAVTREICKSSSVQNVTRTDQNDISRPMTATADDGIHVVVHGGESHEGELCHHCHQCGKSVLTLLQDVMGVGGIGTTLNLKCRREFRDVFVLTGKTDFKGVSIRSPSGVLPAIWQAGIPLRLLNDPAEDADELKAIAVGQEADEIVAAQCLLVGGLERKIIVWLQGGGSGSEDEEMGRLHAMSRCCQELIWVRPY